MKIGNTVGAAAVGPVGNASTPTPGSVVSPRAAKTPSAHGNDDAANSADGQLSNMASTLLGPVSEPTFDQAKVDRIRLAIASGTYTINAEAIADKLIANARDLVNRVAMPG